jgi:hypothetical protein
MKCMAATPITDGSPSQLLCEDGKWVLEVIRYVNVGQNVVRPTTERLIGDRKISGYFSANPDKEGLERGARQLMQRSQASAARSYSAVGGQWIANSLPPPPGSSLGRAPDAALQAQLGELQSRVLALTAIQQGFLTRLTRLEALLRDRAPVELPHTRRELSPAPAQTPAPVREEPPEPAAPPLSPEPAARAPAAVEAAPEPAPAPLELEPVQERKRKDLQLPSCADLVTCMVLLIGNGVSAKEAEPLQLSAMTRNFYGASVLDDQDEELAVIVMDLAATVFLGGTLMMLPRSVLDEQLKSKNPGEDSIAATAEVCNSLCGAINAAQHQHVRLGTFEPIDVAAREWIADAAERRDLVDNFGGRVAVFSRRRG